MRFQIQSGARLHLLKPRVRRRVNTGAVTLGISEELNRRQEHPLPIPIASVPSGQHGAFVLALFLFRYWLAKVHRNCRGYARS